MKNKILICILAVFALTLSGQFRIQLPDTISSIPLTAQSMVVLMIGVLIGSFWGTVSVGLYVLLGVLGLPIFSAWKGGLWIITDPSFGYLLGFIVATYVIGKIWEMQKDISILKFLFHFTIGTFIILVCGTLWNTYSIGLETAFIYGFIPFVPGGIIKIGIGSLLSFFFLQSSYLKKIDFTMSKFNS